MGFAESLGYLIIILATIIFMYFVVKLVPYLSCALATMTLYQHFVTSMAIPSGQIESEAYVLALMIYCIGIIGGFLADLWNLNQRYESMMYDDFGKRR